MAIANYTWDGSKWSEFASLLGCLHHRLRFLGGIGHAGTLISAILFFLEQNGGIRSTDQQRL